MSFLSFSASRFAVGENRPCTHFSASLYLNIGVKPLPLRVIKAVYLSKYSRLPCLKSWYDNSYRSATAGPVNLRQYSRRPPSSLGGKCLSRLKWFSRTFIDQQVDGSRRYLSAPFLTLRKSDWLHAWSEISAGWRRERGAQICQRPGDRALSRNLLRVRGRRRNRPGLIA